MTSMGFVRPARPCDCVRPLVLVLALTQNVGTGFVSLLLSCKTWRCVIQEEYRVGQSLQARSSCGPINAFMSRHGLFIHQI